MAINIIIVYNIIINEKKSNLNINKYVYLKILIKIYVEIIVKTIIIIYSTLK